jgi:hypothetical protein
MPPRKPPARPAARVPQGRHARTGPNARASGRHASPAPPAAPPGPSPAQQRAAARHAEWERRQRRENTRGQVRTVRRAAAVPARGAEIGREGIAKGGQHALMAEFLLFCGIVGLRAVADYVPGDQGQPTEGTSKGAITPRNSQLGPLPILAAGMVVFFVLSFLAARGGAWARIAAVSGLIIDTALLMKSLPELGTVSGAFSNVTQGQAAAAGGTPEVLPTPAGTVNPATDPGIYTAVPDATGLFPVITPNVPPVAQGAGQDPGVFTQPQTGA